MPVAAITTCSTDNERTRYSGNADLREYLSILMPVNHQISKSRAVTSMVPHLDSQETQNL